MFSVVFYNNLFAQDSNSIQKPVYKCMSAAAIKLRKEADSLYNNKLYLQAAKKHKALITEEKGKAAGIMWLNVASNYSLGGNTDSAIVYLTTALLPHRFTTISFFY